MLTLAFVPFVYFVLVVMLGQSRLGVLVLNCSIIVKSLVTRTLNAPGLLGLSISWGIVSVYFASP